jgi:hypothetical protein
MTPEQRIDAARKAIGDGELDDYVIAPAQHASSLAPDASSLARILGRSEITATVRQFETKNAQAIEAQNEFKRNAVRASVAVFVTACLSAAIVVAGPWTPEAWGKWLLIVLGSCGIVAGALGSMWLFKVREGKLLENWLTLRASAEALRVKYFEQVTDAQEPAEPGVGQAPLPLTLLQAEYFRRYQLNVQRTFYRTRGKDHKKGADKLLGIGAIAVGIGSLATGLAGLLGGSVSTRWVSLAGLGVVATALSSFVSTREALNQHRRNQERYARTLDALEDLTGLLDRVRAAAVEGSREPLRQFVAAVHEQLSLEHKQWLGAAESTQSSIAKLEDALAGAKAKPEKPGAKSA